ncbi:hypothetical protein [Chitinophaga barathri]|uniref:Uncharacterized protein n=1 Tax=Chitinophaga barathri TaxID=1647451 RepID=A0A3N4N3C7_9BACT|nr:hypothetical protein [Chitinophaga barathri]RPD42113.1 hypothetical protein EG028_08185 [Chitinophaga barathri]
MKYALCLFPAFLYAITASAQTAEYELYKRSADSCGQSVMLYRDGTFYTTGGCKGAGESSVGQWRQVQDTVFFRSGNPENVKVIQSLTAFTTPGDSLSVVILASCGKNISQSTALSWELPDGGRDPMLISPEGKILITNPPSEGRLLLSVMGQDIRLPSDVANNFVIRLNIPAEWASAREWCRMSRFCLLRKEGRLEMPGIISAVYDQHTHQ